MPTTFKQRRIAQFSVLNQMTMLKQKIPKDEFILAPVAASAIMQCRRLQLQKVIVYLISNGCLWTGHPAGNCPICSLFIGKNQGNIIYEHPLIRQAKAEHSENDLRKYPVFCPFYNAVSILKNHEISRSARINILPIIAAEKNIRRGILAKIIVHHFHTVKYDRKENWEADTNQAIKPLPDSNTIHVTIAENILEYNQFSLQKLHTDVQDDEIKSAISEEKKTSSKFCGGNYGSSAAHSIKKEGLTIK